MAWCVLSLLLLAPPVAAEDGAVARIVDAGIEWSTYREGKAAARHRELPLLIYFTTAWSSGGARLDREVWGNERVRAYMAEHLVAARVDLQEMPAVGGHFGVVEPPAILLTTADGRALVVLRGFHAADSVLRVADYAVTGAWEYADYETWLSRQRTR